MGAARAGGARRRWALLMLLPACTAAAASSSTLCDGDDRLSALKAAPVLAQSRWTEQDAAGRQLLRESGSLSGASLGALMRCGAWQAELDGELLRGTRAYTGRSNAGAPVQTSARIESHQVRIAALHRLHGSADWMGGLRLELRDMRRDLASVGAVLGYPERHRQLALSAGLRGDGALPLQTNAWRWRSELWLGAAPAGRIRVDFPHADSARLRSGVGRQFEASFGLHRHSSDRGWAGGFQLAWREQRTAAGPAAALWRGSVPVGAALQPAHQQTEALVQAWLARRL